jgi:hypothetical protein
VGISFMVGSQNCHADHVVAICENDFRNFIMSGSRATFLQQTGIRSIATAGIAARIRIQTACTKQGVT